MSVLGIVPGILLFSGVVVNPIGFAVFAGGSGVALMLGMG